MFLRPFLLHIPFDGLPVGQFPYRGHICTRRSKAPRPTGPALLQAFDERSPVT